MHETEEWTGKEIVLDLERRIEKKKRALVRAKINLNDMETALRYLKRRAEEMREMPCQLNSRPS